MLHKIMSNKKQPIQCTVPSRIQSFLILTGSRCTEKTITSRVKSRLTNLYLYSLVGEWVPSGKVFLYYKY